MFLSFKTSTIGANSSLVIIAPVGLLGKGIITTFVFSVIASSNNSGVNLKSSSALKFITFDVAPVKAVHPWYATKLGSGIITSSPGPTKALKAKSIPSLPPTVTNISFLGSYFKLHLLFKYFAICSLNSINPAFEE